MAEPAVTIVISPREGHFMSERSLLSVLADDSAPFELIYIDIASPPEIAAALRAQAEAHGFPLVRHDGWIAPALARKQVMDRVKTPYVAFVDNDILVEPGCLKTVLACAEETGAALVCPLYVQAGGGRPPTVHMAGGAFSWSQGDRGELVGEHHRLVGEPLAAAQGLARARADYPEYHYLLGRTAFFARPDTISDEILLIHEHLDLALVARAQGLEVMVEPAARATYVAFEPRPLRDLDFYRRRWGEAECRRSIHAFRDKWLGSNTVAFVESTYDYVARRLHEVELRRRGADDGDAGAPMARTELAQSRFALREQALARGYDAAGLRLIEETADLATLLYDGLYRADGRPFLCHAIGAASALVRYDMDAEIVCAGLLHAAFSHRPAWMPREELAATLGRQPRVSALVLGQPQARSFLADPASDLMSLNVVGGAVAAILAANEADMRLAGEYQASGRPAELSDLALERIEAVMQLFGARGLALSARRPDDAAEAIWPMFGAGVRQNSFRLDAPNRRLLPV